jgi:hypothetical protein
MNKIINILLLLLFLGACGARIYKGILFKQNVTGYPKRAADANTIDLAQTELQRAIQYLEANQLTTGYTSILYRTPDEDIDFWYRNLKASEEELTTLQSTSALEKTNVLMKLRETLLDTGEKTRVTVPEGLAVYPNNGLWAILMTLALLGGFGAFINWTYQYEKAKKLKKKEKKDNQ